MAHKVLHLGTKPLLTATIQSVELCIDRHIANVTAHPTKRPSIVAWLATRNLGLYELNASGVED